MTAPIPRPLAYDIPGPKPLPLIGRTLNTLQFVKDSVGYTRQLFNEYGNLVSLVEGGGTRLYSSRSACPGTVFGRVDLNSPVRSPLSKMLYHKGPLTGPLIPPTQPFRTHKAAQTFPGRYFRRQRTTGISNSES